MIPLDSIKNILEEVGCPYRESVALKSLTSFKIGGETPFLIEPVFGLELKSIIKAFSLSSIPYFILGNGSNLLVSDKGVEFPVIHLAKGEFAQISLEENRLVCGAGAPLTALCVKAQKSSLSGLEFAYGIPGSVGGAVFMNAGAYGGEISQVLESVDGFTKSGEVLHFKVSDCDFSYRKSIFMKNEAIITKAVFRLIPGDSVFIQAKMNEFLSRRKEKQPLEYPSAGSTFKRPAGNFAGALIENAGLKGYSVGGARVSEKHAGFIVNTGEAKSSEVRQLIFDVQQIVLEKFDVRLEPEIQFLG